MSVTRDRWAAPPLIVVDVTCSGSFSDDVADGLARSAIRRADVVGEIDDERLGRFADVVFQMTDENVLFVCPARTRVFAAWWT